MKNFICTLLYHEHIINGFFEPNCVSEVKKSHTIINVGPGALTSITDNRYLSIFLHIPYV